MNTIEATFRSQSLAFILSNLRFVLLVLPFVGLFYLVRATREHNRKPVGGVLAAAGAFLVIFATVRFNLLQSQLSQTDPLSVLLLIYGIPSAFVGLWMLFSASPTNKSL